MGKRDKSKSNFGKLSWFREKTLFNWRILNKTVQAKRFQKQLGTRLLASFPLVRPSVRPFSRSGKFRLALAVFKISHFPIFRPFARSLDRNNSVSAGSIQDFPFSTVAKNTFSSSRFPPPSACQRVPQTVDMSNRQTVFQSRSVPSWIRRSYDGHVSVCPALCVCHCSRHNRVCPQSQQ